MNNLDNLILLILWIGAICFLMLLADLCHATWHYIMETDKEQRADARRPRAMATRLTDKEIIERGLRIKNK